jgi:predicted Fe-Mo cluster-binding NifX family protein
LVENRYLGYFLVIEEERMIVGLPILENKGLESPLCPQFEQAPLYLFWSDKDEPMKIETREELQERESSFLELLASNNSCIITPGLTSMGFKVWKQYGIPVLATKDGTAKEAVDAYLAGKLSLFTKTEVDAASGGCSPSSCSSCSSSSSCGQG